MAHDSKQHWQDVYTSKLPQDTSWYQSNPKISFDLIKQAGLQQDAAILDVGGGASPLVDHLLKDGYTDLSVLDISAEALEHAKARLEGLSDRISWIVSDITCWTPSRSFDLWHDRAVLHFLTCPSDQFRYAEALKAGLRPGGWVIIAGFAPGGPTRCSGLETVQHDAESLGHLLGPRFDLIMTRDEVHRTPAQMEQTFRYHVFRRID